MLKGLKTKRRLIRRLLDLENQVTQLEKVIDDCAAYYKVLERELDRQRADTRTELNQFRADLSRFRHLDLEHVQSRLEAVETTLKTEQPEPNDPPQHNPIPNVSVDELNLKPWVKRKLKSYDIDNLKALLLFSEDELKEIKGIGMHALRDIQFALAEWNLSLKTSHE